jgi:hypothetical protein
VSRRGEKLEGRQLRHFGDLGGFGTITHSEEAINVREDELELARERGTAFE